MSKPQLVIEYWKNKYKLNIRTIADEDYSHYSFLESFEHNTDLKGQRTSKSLYDKNGREAVRQEYSKIVGKFEYNNEVHENVFLGTQRNVYQFFWDGSKVLVGEFCDMFTLHPVFVGDGNETLVGFSSPKMKSILSQERKNADYNLQSQNLEIYKTIYNNYATFYNRYMQYGDKSSLVNALENENNTAVLADLNKIVFGVGCTVKQLILMILQ